MQLFCEECFTYIGPQNFTNCPYCGCDLKENLLVPEPGKPLWENPAELPGHPIARPVYSNGLILITWRKGKKSGGLSAVDQEGRLVWQIFSGETPLKGLLLVVNGLTFAQWNS